MQLNHAPSSLGRQTRRLWLPLRPFSPAKDGPAKQAVGRFAFRCRINRRPDVLVCGRVDTRSNTQAVASSFVPEGWSRQAPPLAAIGAGNSRLGTVGSDGPRMARTDLGWMSWRCMLEFDCERGVNAQCHWRDTTRPSCTIDRLWKIRRTARQCSDAVAARLAMLSLTGRHLEDNGSL